MENIKIDFVKTHPKAKLPTRAHEDVKTGDTGYDMFVAETQTINPGQSAIVNVGLQVAYITPGYWFRIQPKSGLGFKHEIHPFEGTIDNPYRGQLGVKIYNKSNKVYTFEEGDKVAQLVLYPLIVAEMGWLDGIEATDRGEKGFGSTGKQ